MERRGEETTKSAFLLHCAYQSSPNWVRCPTYCLIFGFGLFCVFGTGSGTVVKITINSDGDAKECKKCTNKTF